MPGWGHAGIISRGAHVGSAALAKRSPLTTHHGCAHCLSEGIKRIRHKLRVSQWKQALHELANIDAASGHAGSSAYWTRRRFIGSFHDPSTGPQRWGLGT